MLIGLCGPPCSGKGLVAEYLVRELGFSYLDQSSQLVTTPRTTEIETEEEKKLHSFPPSPSLLSQSWRQDINVVIRKLAPSDLSLPELLKRPYFLLVYVDAPMLVRFKRAMECKRYNSSQLALFVAENDSMKYKGLAHDSNGTDAKNDSTEVISAKELLQKPIKGTAQAPSLTLSDLEKLSHLRVTNSFTTRAALHMALREVRFTDPELLRPSWDTYFMSLAKLAGQRTNCMKRRVGCVLVKNKRIVATGYNGTPSGVKNCFEGGCPRCNSTQSSRGIALDLCLCLHAEENAIVEAGRERCEGSTLYSNLFPCILCSKKIVQSGISRVVFDKHYATDKSSESLLRAGGVLIQKFGLEDVCDLLSRSAITHSMV